MGLAEKLVFYRADSACNGILAAKCMSSSLEFGRAAMHEPMLLLLHSFIHLPIVLQ